MQDELTRQTEHTEFRPGATSVNADVTPTHHRVHLRNQTCTEVFCVKLLMCSVLVFSSPFWCVFFLLCFSLKKAIQMPFFSQVPCS